MVYAVATPKPGKLASTMYFFSKVALYHAARQLRSLGVRVVLARIPLEYSAVRRCPDTTSLLSGVPDQLPSECHGWKPSGSNLASARTARY